MFLEKKRPRLATPRAALILNWESASAIKADIRRQRAWRPFLTLSGHRTIGKRLHLKAATSINGPGLMSGSLTPGESKTRDPENDQGQRSGFRNMTGYYLECTRMTKCPTWIGSSKESK